MSKFENQVLAAYREGPTAIRDLVLYYRELAQRICQGKEMKQTEYQDLFPADEPNYGVPIVETSHG